MELARRAKAKFVAWVNDIAGGSEDSFECDPYAYTTRRDDAGALRPPPAWGGCPADPVGRSLDEGERTEADSCLPFGEKRGRFGTNEEVRVVSSDHDDGGGGYDGGFGGRRLARGAEQQQRRVWSFDVFPRAPAVAASRPAVRNSAATAAAARGDAGPRLRFCWHAHLPIFAVARPDPHDFRGQQHPGQWIIELYEVGSSSGGNNASGIPAVFGDNSSSSGGSTDHYGGGGGSGSDDAEDDGGGISDDGGGGGGGGGGNSNGTAAAAPFRLRLGKEKGAVRCLAFQPHGGANLLVGCTTSLWIAQFTLVSGGGGGGGAGAGTGGAGAGGFRVALAWLACVCVRGLSIFLSIDRSIDLCICLSLSVSLCLSFYLSVNLSLAIRLSFLSISLSPSLDLSLSMSQFLYLPLSLSLCLYLYL